MTDAPDVSPADDRIHGLNVLLRGELAAVSAYKSAMRSAELRSVVDPVATLRFAAEHQRTVAALQGAVREMGGIPATESGIRAVFALVRDKDSVRDLLAGEEAVLRTYEATNGDLGEDANDLLTLELIPRQRRNIAELSAILSRLSA